MAHKKTKILITGGAGYIGSVLTPTLLQEGYSVTVIDSFLYQQDSLIDLCYHPDFTLLRGDVRDESALKPLIAQADYVIPLAAIVGAPACDKDKLAAVSVNRDAVQMLVSMCSRDQKIIIPTTNSGYGIGQKDKFCTEDSPLQPLSLYARTKVEAEKAVLDHGKAVSLRLATVFGLSPRMRLDLLVNDFVFRALKDRYVVVFQGHFKRNYIHIRDVARAFIHVIGRFEGMRGQVYNVGLSDTNISKVELCERIKKYIPDLFFTEAPVGDDPDKRDYIVSNEKIEKTGFKPAFSLDDGIQELIKGYSALPVRFYRNV
jgi:nucleoside-diphosphate-sugar epimerase